MQKLVITNGAYYWNGPNSCWGPREAATTYNWDELPEVLNDGTTYLEIDHHEPPWDAGYYLSDEEPDASAWTQAELGG